MTARPNTFGRHFDLVERARRSQARFKSIECQQRIEPKFGQQFYAVPHEGHRCEAKPPAGRNE
jgi:hypothetical protein